MRTRKLSLLQLAGATYLMVSGGPYGIEELVQSSGYPLALAVLLLVPLIWSLPVGLMVGELASAIPAEGGYYVWVSRALGPFWGFQEAWLSLASSIFDMAVYPTIFTLSLAQIWPPANQGNNAFYIGAAMVSLCILWNLFGARAVGTGSLILGAIFLSPFVILAAFALTEYGALAQQAAAPEQHSFLAGLLVAMWNYMGWDNASTVAGEVEDPQRAYPRVMLLTIAAVFLSYFAAVCCVWFTGLPASAWTTGGWVSIAAAIGGPVLGIFMLLTTMVSMLGIFNSLAMSCSRLPLAMAENGHAPRVFSRRLEDGAPWVSLVVLGIAWIGALRLSFDRLVLLDILTYGVSLILEFVALIALRVREPELPRPFRLPGGLPGAILATLGPLVLLIAAGIQSRDEQLGPYSAFHAGLVIIALGAPLYLLARKCVAQDHSSR